MENSCNLILIVPNSIQLETRQKVAEVKNNRSENRPPIYFSVLGQPNEWYDGKEDDDRHCPIYYFKDYKLKCYWDGEYPEIGVIEFIPYNNINYTIDQFLSNPQKYGIDANTKRFDIYSNGIWWFEVFLDNNKVEKIQYWLED